VELVQHSPLWYTKLDLLIGVPGVVVARTLSAELP
jgi:hypothetical protein